MTDHKYDDIIDLPCPTSPTHPRMPRSDRAAQFAPFSALTGYGDAIDETARLTDERVELTEEMREQLDRKQAELVERIGERPQIAVTYFVPDRLKQGGCYQTVSGRLLRIDTYGQLLVLVDGTRIPASEIIAIESDVLG